MNNSQEINQNNNLDQGTQEVQTQPSQPKKPWIKKALPFLIGFAIIGIIVSSCSGKKQIIVVKSVPVNSGIFENFITTFSFLTNRSQTISALEITTLEDDVIIQKVTVNGGKCVVIGSSKTISTHLGYVTKFPVGLLKSKSSCKILKAEIETNKGTFKFSF